MVNEAEQAGAENGGSLGFAEIEVSQNTILIRRMITEEMTSGIMQQVNEVLISIAENLDGAHSPWDGEDVSAEEAYLSAIVSIARAIREVAMRGAR